MTTKADKAKADQAAEAEVPQLTDEERAAIVERYRHRLQVQYGEYAQWVAAQDITVGGALAFAPGHPVPVAHVERFGYDKMNPPLVRRPDGWSEPGSDDEAVAAELAARTTAPTDQEADSHGQG
jgi:hypothetical protein